MLYAVDRFALSVDRATMLDVHCFDTVGWVIKPVKNIVSGVYVVRPYTAHQQQQRVLIVMSGSVDSMAVAAVDSTGRISALRYVRWMSTMTGLTICLSEHRSTTRLLETRAQSASSSTHAM